MTLFVPALVAATSAAARPVAAPSRPRDVDDHADDDPTLAPRRRAVDAPLAEAVRAIGEDAMTRVFAFRGDAMAPTLRGGARDARRRRRRRRARRRAVERGANRAPSTCWRDDSRTRFAARRSATWWCSRIRATRRAR